jgi:hypothetical protein
MEHLWSRADVNGIVFDLKPKPTTHEDDKALHEHHSQQAVAAGIQS